MDNTVITKEQAVDILICFRNLAAKNNCVVDRFRYGTAEKKAEGGLEIFDGHSNLIGIESHRDILSAFRAACVKITGFCNDDYCHLPANDQRISYSKLRKRIANEIRREDRAATSIRNTAIRYEEQEKHLIIEKIDGLIERFSVL